MPINLLSNTSRVETPFITITIAGQTFGVYNKQVRSVVDESGYSKRVSVTYPNYMQSLTVQKINGQVNIYTLNLIYAIRPGDDPNLLDKLFSKASKDRKIEISYGDLSSPTFVFRKESAIITNVTSTVDFANSSIRYTITCTSEALSLTAGSRFFPQRIARPSDVLLDLLYTRKDLGLLEVFRGMENEQLVRSKGLIASDDKVVIIEAKSDMNVLDYIMYLVSCMTSATSTNNNTLIDGNKYILSVVDDTTGEFGGSYFTVKKVTRNAKELGSIDTYSIDIGFPSVNNVVSFSLDNNQTYSILYDYAQKLEQTDYNYRINDRGEIDYIYAPAIGRRSEFYKTTEVDKTWWTKVTQFPVSATLTIKGLLRPAILTTYLRVNSYFYGKKHISSGTYIITKQVDTVDSNGYRTTLSLLKVSGDEL